MSQHTYASGTTDNWARVLGDRHGRRDQAAALQAQILGDLERDRQAACLQRWPAIVAAMRVLVASYNEGAGPGSVTLTEDPTMPGVTLDSTSDGGSTLVMTLDGTDLSVRTRSGHAGQVNTQVWVNLDRTDEHTATYLLRNWMEQL